MKHFFLVVSVVFAFHAGELFSSENPDHSAGVRRGGGEEKKEQNPLLRRVSRHQGSLCNLLGATSPVPGLSDSAASPSFGSPDHDSPDRRVAPEATQRAAGMAPERLVLSEGALTHLAMAVVDVDGHVVHRLTAYEDDNPGRSIFDSRRLVEAGTPPLLRLLREGWQFEVHRPSPPVETAIRAIPSPQPTPIQIRAAPSPRPLAAAAQVAPSPRTPPAIRATPSPRPIAAATRVSPPSDSSDGESSGESDDESENERRTGSPASRAALINVLSCGHLMASLFLLRSR